jgi:hypothetical protein
MSLSLCVCRWPHGLQIATYVRSKLDDFVGSCQAAVPWATRVCRPISVGMWCEVVPVFVEFEWRSPT